MKIFKDYFTNFCIYSVMGFSINAIFYKVLNTVFFTKFMEENLITIMIALMAINSSTLSIILSKISELSTVEDDFKRTKESMMRSIKEEFIMLFLTVLTLALKSSPTLFPKCTEKEFVFGSLLLVLFIWMIHVLWDISKSVFSIISFKK
ncbi:MAG: hypothetical protein ACOX2F_07330 [bacterium]